MKITIFTNKIEFETDNGTFSISQEIRLPVGWEITTPPDDDKQIEYEVEND